MEYLGRFRGLHVLAGVAREDGRRDYHGGYAENVCAAAGEGWRLPNFVEAETLSGDSDVVALSHSPSWEVAGFESGGSYDGVAPYAGDSSLRALPCPLVGGLSGECGWFVDDGVSAERLDGANVMRAVGGYSGTHDGVFGGVVCVAEGHSRHARPGGLLGVEGSESVLVSPVLRQGSRIWESAATITLRTGRYERDGWRAETRALSLTLEENANGSAALRGLAGNAGILFYHQRIVDAGATVVIRADAGPGVSRITITLRGSTESLTTSASLIATASGVTVPIRPLKVRRGLEWAVSNATLTSSAPLAALCDSLGEDWRLPSAAEVVGAMFDGDSVAVSVAGGIYAGMGGEGFAEQAEDYLRASDATRILAGLTTSRDDIPQRVKDYISLMIEVNGQPFFTAAQLAAAREVEEAIYRRFEGATGDWSEIDTRLKEEALVYGQPLGPNRAITVLATEWDSARVRNEILNPFLSAGHFVDGIYSSSFGDSDSGGHPRIVVRPDSDSEGVVYDLTSPDSVLGCAREVSGLDYNAPDSPVGC